MNFLRFPALLLILSSLSFPAKGLNFLFFLIGSNQFERHIFEFLAQEFARRGHKVVTVKPILVPETPRLVRPVLHMVHEKVLKDVLPRRLYEPLERVGEDVPWRDAYQTDAFLEPYWAAHNHSCERMLNSNLMEVLARAQIELAVAYAGNPCQLAIAHALGLPFVIADLEGLSFETMVAAGVEWALPTEDWSFASLAARSSRALSLLAESVAQSGVSPLAALFSRRYRLMELPIDSLFAGDYEIRRKFRGAFPDANTLRRMALLYLANTDPLLEHPSLALPPRVLPIGGAHIDTVRPLFQPWNGTIALAQDGLILVSFGTQASTSTMPPLLVQSLLSAFARLSRYRVFWRISPTLSLPGLSAAQFDALEARIPHLNVTTFFPQNELLAHPRTRLFITNGGANSLMEALHWGVPVLGIPLYGENRRNLEKIQQRGMGLVLDKRAARDEAVLLCAIRRVLAEPAFAGTARELGREMRSRPASAFEQTLHALESAARGHRNSKQQHAEGRASFPFAFSRQLVHCPELGLCAALLAAISSVLMFLSLKLVALCVRCAAERTAGRLMATMKRD